MRSTWTLVFVLMHIAGFSDAATAQNVDQQRCPFRDPDFSISSRTTAMSQSNPETQAKLPFYNRGTSYAREGQYDRAMKDLGQAIKAQPELRYGLQQSRPRLRS